MNKAPLHARQKKLLSILNVKRGIETGKGLASALGVSERTIRSDIILINEALLDKGIQIKSLHGKGYALTIEDRSSFLHLFTDHNNFISRDDRLRSLMFLLLRSDDWCDLGVLEDDTFVSRTTLESDIRAIKKKVSSNTPFIKLIRRGNMVKFEDDERKRRYLFTALYIESWDYDSRDGIVLLKDEFSQSNLRFVRSKIRDVIEKYGLSMDDFSVIYLTISVLVQYYRIRENKHIAESIDLEPAHPAIKDLIDVLNQEWNIDYSDYEYDWLSKILRQTIILNNHTYNKNQILMLTDPETHSIVNKALQGIDDDYGLDFTSDQKLFVDMSIHVQSLRNGIIATHMLNHMVGATLKKQFPYLGDVAHGLRKKLEEYCKMSLGSSEENYLLPYLISAEESKYKKSSGNGIKCSVISHLDSSITHYLMEQLKKNYGDILDIFPPYPIFKRGQANEIHPDIIITTASLHDFDRLFDVPIILVSPLIDERDKRLINRELSYIKCSMIYPPFPTDTVNSRSVSELIYTMDTQSNLSAIISEIQDKVYATEDLVSKKHINLEKDYFMYGKGGVLFIYDINPSATSITYSIVTLQKSVSWKHVRDVSKVLFVLMPNDYQKYLGWFYHMATHLGTDAKWVNDKIETGWQSRHAILIED